MFLASGPSLAQQGYVYEVSGNVQAVLGKGTPQPVQKNQNLFNNTTVTTGAKGHVVLKFMDGTVVALNENTSFQIQKYEYNEKSPSTMTALFSMVRGALRVITGAMSTKNREGFKIATPSATIGIRGTEFMAQTLSPLIVQGISGITSLTNVAGVSLVGPGQIVSVLNATTLGTTLGVLPPGTFGGLPNLSLPLPTPFTSVPGAAGAGSTAAGAAAGGVGGVAVGAAAAAAGLAAAAAGGSKNPTGTTGTTP